ncbi:MAG TPA: protein-disulfide reductase DsbD domain-containing protein [Blastocatellia bacterium]|nr:protein-disulfide reductase DsbD domain-containing protein [Blastocatellia bacterium]
MKLRNAALLSIIISLLSSQALAQGTGKVVKVSTGESSYKVKKGSTVEVAIVIDIEDGYHINSNRPAEDFLIPTSLKLERLSGISTGRVTYPKAKVQKFEVSEKPMSVYDGKAVIKFTARALRSIAPGSHTLKAKLTVQACDDKQCLRPQTLPIDIPIEVIN